MRFHLLEQKKSPHSFQGLLLILKNNFIPPLYAFPFNRTSRGELVHYGRDQVIRDLKIRFGNPCVSLKYEERQLAECRKAASQKYSGKLN